LIEELKIWHDEGIVDRGKAQWWEKKVGMNSLLVLP
jgi:hypothetical protein